jgi:hypothetical protein
MTTELTDLFARYNSYIDHSKDGDSERDAGPSHEFSAKLWGEPLTFEEFKSRWERICKDPALEHLWKERLAAGRESAIREMGSVVDRLARAASIEGEKAA